MEPPDARHEDLTELPLPLSDTPSIPCVTEHKCFKEKVKERTIQSPWADGLSIEGGGR